MESGWSDERAREFLEQYPDVSEELALRVYTSRLIGAEPDLVLHGGGNTSVKSLARNLFGNEIEVLQVKGSGWDLASIEPAGLPALDLAAIRRLRDLDELDDETMMAELRRALLEPTTAPNPSVETLLHAFLPERFIDHSHADAILVLTNQPDGEKRVGDLLGDRVTWVPYIMPGFLLAKRAAEIYEKSPGLEGMVLEKHGLFTFGPDARQSYERHISLVGRAEEWILEQIGDRRPLDARPVVAAREPAEVAPLVRGALAETTGDPDHPVRPRIIEHRSSDLILHFAAAELGPMLASQPPITPDHAIRTKGAYLFIESPPYGDLAALGGLLQFEVARYRSAYQAYFERNTLSRGIERTPLDPTPRVVVLPGLGLFASGATAREARIAADIAEHTITTKIRCAMTGHYEGLPEADLFEVEYWVLEQAKLGVRTPPPLEGQVALVTGGAGAIGEGVARQLLRAGAHVVLADVDAERLDATCARLDAPQLVPVELDVTDEHSVTEAFEQATSQFGGVDIVVGNAGVAAAGPLDELDPDDFQRAVDVNLNGTFWTVRHALQTLKLQGTGGSIVLISSKNVFAPGAEFGAYSASKAGAHQLGRIAALEGAAFGVRVNMINADAIFGDADNRSGLWESVGPARASARGLSQDELEDFYRDRNLLRSRVTADHVGEAVVFFATGRTPTTGAVLPVDGGLPEAFPR